MGRKAKRFRLTKAAKILLFVVIVALIGGGVFAGLKTGVVKPDEELMALMDDEGNVMNTEKASADTINVSLDEWIG